jgi:hypothetical protein
MFKYVADGVDSGVTGDILGYPDLAYDPDDPGFDPALIPPLTFGYVFTTDNYTVYSGAGTGYTVYALPLERDFYFQLEGGVYTELTLVEGEAYFHKNGAPTAIPVDILEGAGEPGAAEISIAGSLTSAR